MRKLVVECLHETREDLVGYGYGPISTVRGMTFDHDKTVLADLEVTLHEEIVKKLQLRGISLRLLLLWWHPY